MTNRRGSQNTFLVGNLMLDRERREAYLGEEQLALTYQEFEVLSVLLTQQNIVISHTAICRAIWGRAGPQEIKRLGVVISNLRRKLGSLSPYTIETVRSRGYGIVLGESSLMTSPDPTGIHDWHSHTYAHDWMERQDDDARVYLRHVTHLLPFDPDEPIRVLDIGAGYGALTRLILDAFPHSTVVVHDYSEPMLRQARMYLSGASDAVTFVRGDLMSDDWKKDISGEFDAVVSSIAIHNVRHPARIRSIYSEVFTMVSKGGCFFNADYVRPSERIQRVRQHQQLMEQRYNMRQATGYLAADHGGAATAGRGNWQTAPSTAEIEPASLQDHLRLADGRRLRPGRVLLARRPPGVDGGVSGLTSIPGATDAPPTTQERADLEAQMNSAPLRRSDGSIVFASIRDTLQLSADASTGKPRPFVGASELYVVNADGTGEQRITQFNFTPGSYHSPYSAFEPAVCVDPNFCFAGLVNLQPFAARSTDLQIAVRVGEIRFSECCSFIDLLGAVWRMSSAAPTLGEVEPSKLLELGLVR